MELEARANRVRQLIGDAHWLSDGHHHEAIVREFLTRHLPTGVSVSRGFVVSTTGQRYCSPEIDILITDPAAHPPLFSESDLRIVVPSCVIAHFAIKASFSKSNLIDDLTNIAITQSVIANSADANRVWRGICFFEVADSRDSKSILKTVEDALIATSQNLQSKNPEIFAKNSLATMPILPTCITTLSSFTLFVRPNVDLSVTVRLFDLEKLGFACSFIDLFSSVREWFGQATLSEMEEIVVELGAPSPETITVQL